MKICITSSGPDLDDMMDPGFGRYQYFIIVDNDTQSRCRKILGNIRKGLKS